MRYSDSKPTQYHCDAEEFIDLEYIRTIRNLSARLENVPDEEVSFQKFIVEHDGSSRLVTTTSWGGPSFGIISMFGCDGSLLDNQETGYIQEAWIAAVTETPRSDLVIRHETGRGTGWTQTSISVYQILADDSFVSVWTGVSFEGSYQSEEVGAYQTEAEVIFPEPGVIIRREKRVQIVLSENQWIPVDTTERKTEEVYVWNPDLSVFILN